MPHPLRGHIAHRLDRDLEQYVINDETVVVAVRQHWMAHLKPFGCSALLLAAALLVDLKAPPTQGGAVLVQLLWGAWLVSLLWVGWVVLNWRRDWFVATDKRFLMFYGFIHRRVDMMPLTKVTDLSFNRSILGRLLGYGDFTLESAGQHQSLSHIGFLRHADEHYRTICEVLFSEQRESRPTARRPDRFADQILDDGDDGDGGVEWGDDGGDSDNGWHGDWSEDWTDDESQWGEGSPEFAGGVAASDGRATAYPVQTSTDAYAARDARAFGMPVADPPGRRRRASSDAADDLRASWSAWESSSSGAAPETWAAGEVTRRGDTRRADTDEIPVVRARPMPRPPSRRQSRSRAGHLATEPIDTRRPSGRSGARSSEPTEALRFPPEDWLD